MFSFLFPVVGFDHDGHRAVVDKFQLHLRAELAGLHRFQLRRAQTFDEALIAVRRERRLRRFVEAGATPPACIAVQREVRDDERLEPELLRRDVQLALIILKNAERRTFLRQLLTFRRIVRRADAKGGVLERRAGWSTRILPTRHGRIP